MVLDGIEIVLDAGQVDELDGRTGLLDDGSHAQDAQADEDAFIQKKGRRRNDQADRRRHASCTDSRIHYFTYSSGSVTALRRTRCVPI